MAKFKLSIISLQRAGRFLPLLFVLPLASALPGAQEKSTTHDNFSETALRREEAMDIFNENDCDDALPLLQDFAVGHPKDAGIQEAIGSCLMRQAASITDPGERRQARIEARQAFLRAQALGDTSLFLTTGLKHLPEDGSDWPPKTSSNSAEGPEARQKYVDAVVASPYNTTSWADLKAWAQKNSVAVSELNIQSPDRVTAAANGANVSIDASSLTKKNGAANWILYDGTRLDWRQKRFAEKFPNEVYRHSLAEEVAALSAVAEATAADVASGKIKQGDLDPQVGALLKLKSENLLEAHVLLNHPDLGIQQDYAAYDKEHHDKLVAYMNEYVVPATR